MFLISVDFSKDNLLTEQLNVRSFYDLPVLNCSLIEHQLKNFADITIQKAYLMNGGDYINDISFINTVSVDLANIYRDMPSFTGDSNVFLFRNDVYFECNISEKHSSVACEEIIGIKNNEGFCFAAFCSLKALKKLYNRNIDFFELMNNHGKYISSYINADGYTKELKTVENYKSLLFDILNGVTIFKPPYIAEGIFTDGIVPKGDFSITPPVYLGDLVQIENGSTIGPNAVIFNNSLVSKNTSVKNSVLFENVYVSSNCFIDGAICCENSSIKRNSAVFAGTVIGANALIGEDITVENNSLIHKNVRYDNYLKSPFTNKISNSFKDKFQGLSPEKAALLGSAVAVVFGKPRILIASDGEPNSQSIKLAFLSGLISSGAESFDVGNTFKSHIFFCCKFCECDYSVFVSGRGGGTNVEIFNSKNEILSKAECYNLFDFCNKGEFLYVKPNECKNVRQIHGLRRMYIREVTSLFENNLCFFPRVICENKLLLKTFEEILKKVTQNTNTQPKMHITLNDNGTNASIKYNDTVYTEKDLKRLVFFYSKKKENAIYFDYNAYADLWKADSVFLVFAVIKILNITGENIDSLITALPSFYTNSKIVISSLKTGETAKKIDDLRSVNYKHSCYNIKLKNGLVKVVKNRFSNETKIICAAENMSVCTELCDFVGDLLEES